MDLLGHDDGYAASHDAHVAACVDCAQLDAVTASRQRPTGDRRADVPVGEAQREDERTVASNGRRGLARLYQLDIPAGGGDTPEASRREA
jgi:hypothetical protein